jgi:hypothetical protein
LVDLETSEDATQFVLILGQGAAYALACLAVISAEHASPLVVSGLQLGWHCLVWNLIPTIVCLWFVHSGHRWLLRWAYRGAPVVVAWAGSFFVLCAYTLVGLVWVRYFLWTLLPIVLVELRGGYDAALEELNLMATLAELPGNSGDPEQLAILASLVADSSAAMGGVGGVLLVLSQHWYLVAAYQTLALLC